MLSLDIIIPNVLWYEYITNLMITIMENCSEYRLCLVILYKKCTIYITCMYV